MICRQDDKVLAEARRVFFTAINGGYRIEWVCLMDGVTAGEAAAIFRRLIARGYDRDLLYMDVRDRDGGLVIRESRGF